LVHTNLTLSGAVAQYDRGIGMIQATAAALMKQFANNLKEAAGSIGRWRSARGQAHFRTFACRSGHVEFAEKETDISRSGWHLAEAIH